MGQALTKDEVMCMADDILQDWLHVDKLGEFCKKGKLQKMLEMAKLWVTDGIKLHIKTPRQNQMQTL
jgi:hypothetical protein